MAVPSIRPDGPLTGLESGTLVLLALGGAALLSRRTSRR